MVLDSVSLIFSLTSTASVRTKMGMAKSMDKASYEVVWPVSHAHITWNRCLITMGINRIRTAHTAGDGRQLRTVQGPS